MPRKRPFKFEFNEDAEPVEELHRLRAATAKHFKTIDAIVEYHRSTPPIKEIIAELDEEIKAKTARKPAARRNAAKRLIHA